MPGNLANLLDPATTVLLTQECQRGIIGADSALPELAAAVRAHGALANIAALVTAARGVRAGVLHAVAARRADGRGASTNARLFRAAARFPVVQLPGTDAVRVVEEIGEDEWDLYSTRYAGLSPILGTDADALLRNLGCATVVLVGVSTNVAIPNAVFDLVNLGYEVVLPSDAIAGVPDSYAPILIENTLSLITTVVSTADVLAVWQ